MPNSAPIMKLPPELHCAIAKVLNFPGNVMLGLSSRYFYETIDRLTFEQLVDGWRSESYKSNYFLQPCYQPCYDCRRLRPAAEFELGIFLGSRGIQRQRSCIQCKFQQQREGYEIGDLIRVGLGHVFCGQCDEFNGGDIPRRVEGLCQECWGRFEGQGYRFSLDDDEYPAFRIKEHTSKLKTSVAWLHHGIWCMECRKLFDRCQRARGKHLTAGLPRF